MTKRDMLFLYGLDKKLIPKNKPFIMILIIFTTVNTYIALAKLTHFILLTTEVGSFYYLSFIGGGIENTKSFSNLLKVTNQKE